jgi:hypothetical protein
MEGKGSFGFEPDENGNIEFMTIKTECVIHDFEQYMELFSELVRIANDYDNRFMPVIIFDDEQRK